MYLEMSLSGFLAATDIQAADSPLSNSYLVKLRNALNEMNVQKI